MVVNANILRIGIGTYRMVVGNQNHEAALRRALNRFAINNPQDNTNSPSSQSPTTPKLLIDTSSNYGDGASEKLIGKMVKQLNVDRNRLHIVTKVGYVQGQNLKLFRQGLFSGIDDQFVRYHEDCLHCIHPEFIRDQITRSLSRLQTDFVDTYLLHNPEYYLMDQIGKTISDTEVRRELTRRIAEAFEALEEQVEKGAIKSYGISSNSFAVPALDPHFLPYDNLVDLAIQAARKVRGTEQHKFSTIQLPGNLLETEGLEHAAIWARERGLVVLGNRPLNAFPAWDQSRGYRLASFPPPPVVLLESSRHATMKVLESSTSDLARILKDLIVYLESQTITIPTLGSSLTALNDNRDLFWLETIRTQINMLVYKSLQQPHAVALKASDRLPLVSAFGEYLTQWDRQRRFEASEKMRIMLIDLKVLNPKWRGTIQEYAVRYLLRHRSKVDCVLMGTTREDYVRFVEAMLMIKE